MSNSSRMAVSFAPAYFHHWRSKSRIWASRSLSSPSLVRVAICCAADIDPPAVTRVRFLRPGTARPPSYAQTTRVSFSVASGVHGRRTSATVGPVSSRSSLPELIAEDWAEALAPVSDQVTAMGDFLRAEAAAGRGYLPAGEHVLRAFTRPLAEVKVLIVGQDPYPTPGHAMGLSFSVQADVRPLPRSLMNIFTELGSDLGLPAPSNGDLSPWADAGVLLLNRSLTVQSGKPASHRGKGWEQVTDQAIRALVARDQPLVAVLWGRDAQSMRPLLGRTPVIESTHPSPLSASRGFFGSRPFSRANELLADRGGPVVDWALP